MAEQKAGGWATPYKYIGKEQDEQIGMYDYGARFYDPSISLWASMDPLTGEMPDQGAYNYTFQNPIMYNDPTGMKGEGVDNDYFDKHGNYLGSDNRGDEVRIVGDNALEKSKNLSGDKKMNYYSSNSEKFSDVRYGGKTKDTPARIAQHYYNENIGCNDVCFETKVGALFEHMAVGPKIGEPALRHRDGSTSSEYQPTIQVGVSGYGKASSDLDNKYVWINIIAHEYDHFSRLTFDGGIYTSKATGIGSGDGAISLHLETYMIQKNHWSFNKTPKSFRSGFKTHVSNYLDAFKDGRLSNLWWNKFNR